MSDEGDPQGPLRSSSPRPGPDALYGPTPTPPPLENGDGWSADPLLVCGAEAYVEGEYLYQDYVHDDHGADQRSVLSRSPRDARSANGSFSPATGDLSYPTDHERYVYNAADLLEFRARVSESPDAEDAESPEHDEIVYRITLNAMTAPAVAAVAIGIDTSGTGAPAGGRTDWGYGLGDLGASVDHVLVTWGTGAELDGERLADDRVRVDVERNQIEVRAPLDPGQETWRHYCAVGLWDTERERFTQPAVNPDEHTPGGARSDADPPPVFNVGFRFEEPLTEESLNLVGIAEALGSVLAGGLPRLATGAMGRLAPGGRVGAVLADLRTALDGDLPRTIGRGNWREYAQAQALAQRDISRFHADVDFGCLRDEVDDDRVPESGYLTFLYPSRYDYARQGADPSKRLFWGRIQPYAAYVPADLDPDEPAPMTLLLHSLGCNHNEYGVFMPALVEGIAEAHGGLVVTPEARGPGRWYRKRGEVDVFEAWRDLERRYEIDRDRVTVAGYSMGGFGAQVLAAKYPDLFGRAFAAVSPPSEDPVESATMGLLRSPATVTRTLFGGRGGGEFLSLFSDHPENAMRVADNLRHVPMLLWNGGIDPLVPVTGPVSAARRLRRLGYRHQLDVFPAATHVLPAIRDRWDRAPAFLAAGTVTRNPPRVTYRRVPAFDEPELGLAYDGAHWLSAITVRDDADEGFVDAVSLAEGYDEPVAEGFRETGSTPQRRVSTGATWVDLEPVAEPANELRVTLEGVEAVVVWIEEAGLDPEVGLRVVVDSDGPSTVTLAGSVGREVVPVSEGVSTVELGPLAGPDADDASAAGEPGVGD